MTRLFVPIVRNFDKDLPLEDVYAFNRQVFEEDRAIVELQCPEDLPIDRTAEAPILADRSSGAIPSRIGRDRARPGLCSLRRFGRKS